MARGDSKIDTERERKRREPGGAVRDRERARSTCTAAAYAKQLPKQLATCLTKPLASCILASCRFYVDISSTLIKCVDFNVFLIFHAYPWRIFRCCWPTGSGWAWSKKIGKSVVAEGLQMRHVCPFRRPTCFLSSSSLFCFVLFSLNDRITRHALFGQLWLCCTLYKIWVWGGIDLVRRL